EEFCMIMPGADQETALKQAEMIRANIEAMTVMHEGKEMKVTLSVGVSLFDPKLDLKTNKTMVERSDRALYACKRGGRNQVQIYSSAME
ncbi:MAG: GGDEF domain-containing protein, partial [Leptospirales bacterium]